MKEDFSKLIEGLQTRPFQGSSLGNNCYKIRMAISPKGKGKSGRSRIITFVKIIETTVYLLSVYDKSEKENITDKELLKFIGD